MGKPRPAVVVQDYWFEDLASITVCGFTTIDLDAPLFRLTVEPSQINGLTSTRRIMVDKITTVPRSKLGCRIGRLGDTNMVRLNRAVLIFLGLAE